MHEQSVTAGRIGWIDLARGLACILVVMTHVREYALVLVPPDPAHVFRWSYLEPLLVHIRLPLFFLISGLLVSQRLEGPRLRSGLRRTGQTLLIYLGWGTLLAIILPHWPNDHGSGYIDPAALLGLLWGHNLLWYLWAIILAFLFACATRMLPPFLVLLLACAPDFLHYAGLISAAGDYERFGHYLFFYCFGARLPEIAMRVARWRSSLGAALLIIVYATLLPTDYLGPLGSMLNSLAGVTLALMGTSWASDKLPRFAGALAWLGRYTLPIYIFHFPVVAFLGCAAIRHGVPSGWTIPAMAIFAPALTTAAILISLGTVALLRHIGLGRTLGMTPPKPVQRARQAENATMRAVAP